MVVGRCGKVGQSAWGRGKVGVDAGEAGPGLGYGAGPGLEGRGLRARARSRRAPSRAPCWLVCGCQTELDAADAAAAVAAAPLAPVAPASPALPTAAATHLGRPGGAEVMASDFSDLRLPRRK